LCDVALRLTCTPLTLLHYRGLPFSYIGGARLPSIERGVPALSTHKQRIFWTGRLLCREDVSLTGVLVARKT
jgi:hypothetical protein